MNPFDEWTELNAEVVALHQQGVYARAINLAEEALRFAESAFGASHLHTAESLNNMALVYYAQGKYFQRLLSAKASADTEETNLQPDRSVAQQCLNKVVLSDIANRKYAEAEILFKRALAIKYENLQQDHPAILKSLGNLAELYNTQGKHAEAEILLRSIGSIDDASRQRISATGGEAKGQVCAETNQLRQAIGIRGRFPAKISNAGLTCVVTGMTENLSKSGALIRTRDWDKFKVNDKVAVTISVPSPLSNQGAETSLQGMGQITRVEEEDEAVKIQFTNSLKESERVGELEIAGKFRYKKVAHYLSLLNDLTLAEFTTKYSQGFLIEKFHRILDKKVIFQFSTQVVDDPAVLSQLQKDSFLLSDVLEMRVIEIKKRKQDEPFDAITVGRSADNDIVLYNRTISKAHACLRLPCHEADLSLVDVGSANGTFLNNKELNPKEPYSLSVGDEISFGPQTKVVYLAPEDFYEFLSALTTCST